MPAAEVTTPAEMPSHPTEVLRIHVWGLGRCRIRRSKHGRVRLRHMGWMNLLQRRGQRGGEVLRRRSV